MPIKSPPRQLRATLLLVFAAAAAVCVPAQDGPSTDPRATIAGRLVAADGEPWGGARVILSAHTTPCAPELGTIDRVEVTASDSGIFRAPVLTGLGYTVRALQRRDDGSVRRSSIRHGAVPGALVSLEEIDPQPAFRIHVTTDPAWADLAPFSLRITFTHPNLEAVDLALDAENSAAAPPLPDGWASCLVLDRHGEPLWKERMHPTSKAAKDGRYEVEVPAPVEVPVVVTDASGAPLPDATIRQRVVRSGYSTAPHDLLTDSEVQLWRTCGTTGEDGRAVVRAPLGFDPFGPLEQRRWKEAVFAAMAEGRAQAHSGHCQQNVFWNGERQADDAKELHFLLRDAKPLGGRLLAAEDQPLADVPVLVTADSKMNAHQNGWTHLELRFLVRTDADGRWTVPAFPDDGQDVEIGCALPESLRAHWSTDDLQAGRYAMLPEVDRDKPQDFDLSRHAAVRIEIRDLDQGPAVGAQLEIFDLSSTGNRGTDRDVPWIRRIDRRGRTLLHLPPGEYGLLAADEKGLASQKIHVGPATDEPQSFDLSLEPWPTARFKVKGSDGAVPESVSSYICSYSYSGNEDQFDAVLRTALQNVLNDFANRPTWQDGVLTVRCKQFRNTRYELRVDARGYEAREVPLEPAEGSPQELILTKSK